MSARITGTNRESPRRLTCAQCGTVFDCMLGGDCWCMAESFRLPIAESRGGDCLCRDCLRLAAAAQERGARAR